MTAMLDSQEPTRGSEEARGEPLAIRPKRCGVLGDAGDAPAGALRMVESIKIRIDSIEEFRDRFRQHPTFSREATGVFEEPRRVLPRASVKSIEARVLFDEKSDEI